MLTSRSTTTHQPLRLEAEMFLSMKNLSAVSDRMHELCAFSKMKRWCNATHSSCTRYRNDLNSR